MPQSRAREQATPRLIPSLETGFHIHTARTGFTGFKVYRSFFYQKSGFSGSAL